MMFSSMPIDEFFDRCNNRVDVVNNKNDDDDDVDVDVDDDDGTILNPIDDRM